MVVGTVIGSAIFLVPGEIARALPDRGLTLLAWLCSGLLSFFGALAYAELGAMLPSTGGQYVYLRTAYGRLPAFLCGWTFFFVIQSGGIATMAVGFSIYLGYFVKLAPWASRAAAVGLIGVLSWINYRGVRQGAAVQNLFTVLKLGGLAALIAAAFLAPAAPAQAAMAAPFHPALFGTAMIACLWAYEGWNMVSFVAGEVRQPQRNLPRALALGTGLVVVVYLLANAAYLRVLPMAEVARTSHVAAAAAERGMGHAGALLVAVTILVSIVGAVNGSILTAPRVYFAQARDGLFFRSMAALHPEFRTPGVAIWLQAGWAALLALTDSYELLFSFVMFGAWLLYGLTVLGVVVLRRTRPGAERPYRMWGYPLTPLLFVATSGWLVVNTFWTAPRPSLAGVAIISSGVPAYYRWRRGKLK